MTQGVFQWRSLKTRVTFATLVVIVIGIWSLAFYVSRMLREDMQRLLSEQQLSMVSLVAASINSEFESRIAALEIVAGGIDPSLLKNPAALQRLLDQKIVLPTFFNGGVHIVGADAVALADVSEVQRVGKSFADNEDLRAVLAGEKRNTVGRPLFGRLLQQPVFPMISAIVDAQGRTIGAVIGTTNLGKPGFLGRIAQSRFGQSGGYQLLAPQHRLIVTASDPQRVMEALPEAGANPLLDRLLTQGAGAAVGIDPAGVEVLMAGQRIPMAGWIILASLPTTEAFAPIQAMQQRMLLAATIFTLLAVGLIGWVLRRQLSPLLTSIEMLAEMAGNKRPTQPLPIARQDEIGQLLAAFNQLLERLQQREAALKESESRWKFDYATLQRIFDALPVGIWIADTEGRLKINNPAGHEIWQGERWVGPEAYGEYKGWWSANGRPLAAQDWAMARTLATGETSIDEMIDIECFDGSRKTILNSATMIVDADGRPSCALVVNQDITALKAVQDDLTQAGRQLAALSGELLAVQERERQALSHELHDEIGQSLTALRITLETARRGAVEPEMTTLAYAISIVDTLLDDVREIARGLRPSQLDELGLLPALRWHVDKIGQTTGLHCALESDIGDRRFLPALELACFRTAQEAITNALRHARASEINLSLTLGDDGLQLSVRDNGVGFDGADLRHTPLGLLGMRERVAGLGGSLRIDSAPGAGTEIFATFPLEILS